MRLGVGAALVGGAFVPGDDEVVGGRVVGIGCPPPEATLAALREIAAVAAVPRPGAA